VNVRVVGAPGYEDFQGEFIMKVSAPDERELVIIGESETKEIFVIGSEYVTEIE
jgi:hypothetical protein